MPPETGKSSGKSGDPQDEAPRTKRTASGPEPSGLVAFTLDVRSGRIVKVEAVGSAGDRRDLSAEEALRLATHSKTTLEDVLERTFEAGISSVLDDASLEDGESESEEEADLRRAILRPLIERSAARDLLKREVLGRAILGTLIEDALASRTTTASAPKASTASASKAPTPPSRPATGGASRRPQPRGRPH